MLPPGPRAPVLWQTYRFVAHPATYTERLRRRYGDVVRFRSLLGPGIAVLDAGLAREVFAAPPDTFETVPVVESLFGPSAVIFVSGERHRRLRKLLNPSFHGAQVKGFLSAMQRAIRANLERLGRAAGTREIVTLTDVTQATALDVIIETVFGAGEVDRDDARRVLRDIVHGTSPSLVAGRELHKPWFPPWRRFVRVRDAFDRWAYDVIRARRARGEGDLGDDVLGVLLSARYEDGAAMTDAEVRDQLVTILLAGHETSAIAMAWAVYHLLRNPHALTRLRTELDALGPEPSPEAMTRHRYLDAVVSETLRIEPIATDVVRVCRQPFVLGGKWRLAPGETIAVLLVSILRDARYFPEPRRFRPERFLEKDVAAAAFLPFGGGARRCLGAAFAQAELALAVAEIATSWELELAPGPPEKSVRRHVTMGPSRGVPIRVLGRRRHTGAEGGQSAPGWSSSAHDGQAEAGG